MLRHVSSHTLQQFTRHATHDCKFPFAVSTPIYTPDTFTSYNSSNGVGVYFSFNFPFFERAGQMGWPSVKGYKHWVRFYISARLVRFGMERLSAGRSERFSMDGCLVKWMFLCEAQTLFL